jgi:hypothetical protein
VVSHNYFASWTIFIRYFLCSVTFCIRASSPLLPLQFLLDEPAVLTIVEFHPQKLSGIYEIISGYEKMIRQLRD